MDRPDRLSDDVAATLKELDSHELRAASRYAERLAERRERSNHSHDSGEPFFRGGGGETYYETSGVWDTIKLDDDT